jgi:N-acylneuraminate cytidylyltransferase
MFCGKPMLAWSIEAARASGCFDQVIVSTDDAAIAALAVELGAEAPFLRPAALADDHAGTIPVIQHAVAWYRDHVTLPEQVCCLYATAPFVRVEDLRAGHTALTASDSDYVFTVTHYPYPIQRALRLTPEGCVEMFQPDQFQRRSQDLEPAFHDAGQFYWGRAQAWLDGISPFGGRARPLLLPAWRVQDIDTPEDWVRAELLFRQLQAGAGELPHG